MRFYQTILCVVAALGLGASALANGSKGGPVDKVVVCHVPPGNPDNAHEITVGEPAVAAHLAHGDSLGSCDDGGGEH